ncbi:bis-aminopropyl spermidine synthase family protein [Saccharopolyspora griseoalba]|uniref:Bis-aminopropyl spermidine synthase family protein n=1 Tax=Saccharopolyspora griseoalba TaxID=1431848 RepID=A0ABW2LH63_9PSEU
MNSAESEPIEAVRELLSSAGPLARRAREVLAELTGDPRSLDEIIRRTGVSRRTVEDFLDATGEDLERTPTGYRLTDDAAARYRAEFALDELGAPPTRTAEQLGLMAGFITTGPPPTTALDHVTATPETALRRAEWMRDNYDLAGAKVLCLGDHDLTSLALSIVEPRAQMRVVDLDERILRHIDSAAAERGYDIGSLHADLRFGLPPELESWADLVFTDPPYTAEGIGLFAARAAECLAPGNSRLLLAYGYSPRTPALGHKVQQELLRLGMVFEAILPRFHSYYGAQAIGSTSDLYVCQPTAHTRKLALRQASSIYTHGPQSVEAVAGSTGQDLLESVSGLLGSSVTELRSPGWARPVRASGDPAVFDLRADPGPWLLRMLLACNAERVGFLVDNNHPDITNQLAQTDLIELVSGKFRLRFHRSTPDSKHAVVLAEAVESDSVAAQLLRRAHGKLGNTWREGLIARTGELTKREAKQQVAELAPNPDDLARRLIDLPRHRASEVLARARS